MRPLVLAAATLFPGFALHDRVVEVLQDPNAAVLMLALGGLLICLEFNRPGWVLPGMTGLLLVLLAVWGLQRMPLSMAGLALTAAATGLVLLGARLPLGRLWAVLGVCALPVGLAMLVGGPGPRVRWPVAVGAGLGFGPVAVVLMEIGMRARWAKRRLGAEALLGCLGLAETPLTPEGRVLVGGELWRATVESGTAPVPAGSNVRVMRAEGRVLAVMAVAGSPEA